MTVLDLDDNLVEVRATRLADYFVLHLDQLVTPHGLTFPPSGYLGVDDPIGTAGWDESIIVAIQDRRHNVHRILVSPRVFKRKDLRGRPP